MTFIVARLTDHSTQISTVILHTTVGEILVELFAKQAPLACRNFLQLSLDGYYDNTIFHRLVPGFVLQGGDPTGTGNGGESIYDGGAFGGDLDPWPMDQRRGGNAGDTGINFRDEFHSRLKFTRRGLLAMANEGRPDTNGSQFFFTLDKTEDLNGKNTLFGRVAGDTIYNLMKIGEAEVDQQTERPLYPARILRVEILVNPFEGMKKRSRIVARHDPNLLVAKQKKQKRRGGKQLLSFGDEEGDEEGDEAERAFKRTKFDTRLIAGEDTGKPESTGRKHSQKCEASKESTGTTAVVDRISLQTPKDSGDGETRDTRQDRKQSSPKQPARSESPKPTKSALEKANEELAALKASMRRTIESEQATKDRRRTGGNASSTDDAATLRMFQA
ncbi:hypothetical protein CDD81_294 [Ophiocordyceps australis]|uniref:PPIase cyclophilin-type domain-containing protein n=1 Tax=Ophiocordyceps australis TaxID=1399860 RepID=A0A2C5Y1H4_9HYPO|nr:hypothetical protein CDD81_294 [Ophiocordyceps australis]